MLPTAATTLAAAQFAYLFENEAKFLTTLILNLKRKHK